MKKLNLFILLLCTVVAQSAFATPNCQPCPYSCNDLGLGHKDCSLQSNSGGICCLDLTQKGLEIAAARAAVNNGSNYGNSYNNNNNYNNAECPAGFHVSSSKCSPDERRRGCKDLHGRTGQTCTNK